MKKRSSGILMHISSLPGEYGIGDFGKNAYSFVDFLYKAGQKNWQILPLGMTGYKDSPYQCFCAFAGNPYFIDLDDLIDKGLIEREEALRCFSGTDETKVDYGLLYREKFALLRSAYEKFADNSMDVLEGFLSENYEWLRGFSLFMAIKDHHKGKGWMEWDEKYRHFESEAVREYEKNNPGQIFFWVFTQYFFFRQWHKLKKYANSMGIRIIGDLPIYVSSDGSDIWTHPKLFDLDENLRPLNVAGCPPDSFSPAGQLWGNPLYNWEEMKKNGYSWWIKRIRHSMTLYDTLRVDHFRGFESYWQVPAGSNDAVNGKWIKGPGLILFDEVRKALGEIDIIAEDLGFLTSEVRDMIKSSGFPGMKILQFGFEGFDENEYMPHNYIENSVAYTGTHDNPTSLQWFYNLPAELRERAGKYLVLDYTEKIHLGIVRGVWASSSRLAIAPLQDFLGEHAKGRMNTPSTSEGNWIWRVKRENLTENLAKTIHDMTKTYYR